MEKNEKNGKNEKSEKRRFSVKPKIESQNRRKSRISIKPKVVPIEKDNINITNKRRHSKMIKPQIQEKENQQQNLMIKGMAGGQPIQGVIPFAQSQLYPDLPQMMENDLPIIMSTTPVKGLSSNAYITNQIGPPMAYEALNYGLDPHVTINKFCPYCGHKYVPKVEENFNCCTCFIYIIIILLIPILLVLAIYSGCQSVNCNNGCDCNCNCCYCGTRECNCCLDRNYFCSKCGKKIDSKNSCIELCPCFKCFVK